MKFKDPYCCLYCYKEWKYNSLISNSWNTGLEDEIFKAKCIVQQMLRNEILRQEQSKLNYELMKYTKNFKNVPSTIHTSLLLFSRRNLLDRKKTNNIKLINKYHAEET